MTTNELILGIVTLFFTAVVTPLMIYFLNKKQSAKVDVVEKKLDENFKQANGHFTKLLEAKSKLAKEEGKQEEKKHPSK